MQGEDFHNPSFDDHLVHRLGRFNQTFKLFKANYIDENTLNYCQAHVGKKRGPYPVPIQLPLDCKLTENLDITLDSIKFKTPKDDINIPALFVLGVQNYDNFDGRLKKNTKKEIVLHREFKIYVLDIQKVKVQE